MKNAFKLTLALCLLVLVSGNAKIVENTVSEYDAHLVAKDAFVGGWAYTVQGAPAGYENGFLLVLKENKTYKAQIQVNGKTLMAQDVAVKKNTMTFHLMVEDQKVMVTLMATGSELSGTTESAKGIFQISGKKTLSAGE